MRRIVWSAVAGLGVAGLIVAAPAVRADEKDKAGPGGSTQMQHGQAQQGGAGSGAAAGQQENKLTGKIEKYDRENKTLTLDSSDKKLKLSDDTHVMKGGAKSSVSDLKEGDQIRASFSGAPTAETLEVVTIEVLPAAGAKETPAPGTGMGAKP